MFVWLRPTFSFFCLHKEKNRYSINAFSLFKVSCSKYFYFFLKTEYARFENGRFVYRINRSPMCEYMINFIHKLKHLPEKYMMNSVLENFTILLVWTHSLFFMSKILSALYGLLNVQYLEPVSNSLSHVAY